MDFETTTGTKLFDRTARGVKLTPAGHLAMQHALRLFQGFEQFSSEIREPLSTAAGFLLSSDMLTVAATSLAFTFRP